MRVLILSANTGGGHNSVAIALSEYFEKVGVTAKTADTLKFISEKASDFISWGHSYVYRKLPRLFGLGYRFEERHSPRFIYEQCAKGVDALQESLERGEYDAVICVHVFAGMMMTELRKRYGTMIPTFFVATDYTCSPGVSKLDADGFFIPHRMLLGEFVRNGISADKLFATGIPVRKSFYDMEDRVQMRRSLRLSAFEKVVLFSCGSMGCGRLEQTATLLSQQLPSNTILVVICGKNEKAYEALIANPRDNMRVVGFTEHMSFYMSSADLYVTKPGGLTTTEAIVKRLPMVFFDAVPGLETRNFDFLIGTGVAVGGKGKRRLIASMLEVLDDFDIAKSQIKAMEAFQAGNAAEQICKQVIGTCVAK